MEDQTTQHSQTLRITSTHATRITAVQHSWQHAPSALLQGTATRAAAVIEKPANRSHWQATIRENQIDGLTRESLRGAGALE
jgi:hypothetical protein